MFPRARASHVGHFGLVIFASLWWPTYAQPAAGKAGSAQEDQRDQLLKDLGLKKGDHPRAASSPTPAPVEATPPAIDSSANTDVAPRDSGGKAGAVSSAPAPSFRRVVHGLLMQTCTPCHAAGGQGAGTRFRLSGESDADYATVSRLIDLRDPAASVLLTKPSGAIHAGGTPWPTRSVAYGRVLAWIQRGARLDGAATATTAATVPAATTVAAPAAAKAPVNHRSNPPANVAAEPVIVTTPSPMARAVDGAEAPATDFAAIVHPVLMSACAGCHGPKGPAATSRLTLSGVAAVDLPIVERLLDREVPAHSLLLTKSAGIAHGGGPVIPTGDARHALLLAWIGGVVRPGTPAAPASTPASIPASPATAAPVTVDGALPPAPPRAAVAPTPAAWPFGFALNGRFDVTYERRQFSGDPFAAPAVNALRSYHHFLFLTRESTDDPFGLSLEVLSLQFWEVHARLGGLTHGRPWQLLLSAGKILVPFGADPLTHQSYGGLSGFDQRILPVIWAQEGAAAHLTVQRGGMMLTDDLFVVRGYALQAADGVLNLQNDFSADDDARLGWGNRLGVAWLNLSAWYSAYFNTLGFSRHLFMQAVDVMVWRPRHIPVLGHFSAGAGFLRADVSGGNAEGVGGPGRDYYHFGSYFQLRYHPNDWLYVQYRQGLRTFDNRRGVIVDDTRLTSQDGSTHNIGVVARCRGLSLGVYYFINLEKVDEVPDDLFRVSLTYDF